MDENQPQSGWKSTTRWTIFLKYVKELRYCVIFILWLKANTAPFSTAPVAILRFGQAHNFIPFGCKKYTLTTIRDTETAEDFSCRQLNLHHWNRMRTRNKRDGWMHYCVSAFYRFSYFHKIKPRSVFSKGIN